MIRVVSECDAFRCHRCRLLVNHSTRLLDPLLAMSSSRGRDEMDIRDARQRIEIHRETTKTGRMKAAPKARSSLVHICLPNDSTAMKKLQSNRVTKAMVDKMFGMPIDHLQDQFGAVCEW